MKKTLFLLLFLTFATSVFAQATEETNTKIVESVEGNPKPEDTSDLPVDVRMKRVILRYKSEVSFLMPEGEFFASLEKKIGQFSSIAKARYNFLRGEMEFMSQNIYTKYNIVPQVTAYDKLRFVPIFEDGKTWRREQGFQIGGRLLFPLPANALTSVKYIRYSSPSEENLQTIKLEKAAMISQSAGWEADSTKFFGLYHSGIIEFQIDRAYPVRKSDLDYTQFHIKSTGKSSSYFMTLEGEFNLSTILHGDYAPPRFLGGRNKLSGFNHNEFSGLNSAFLSLISTINLRKRAQPLAFGISVADIAWRFYYEAGQVGKDVHMWNFGNYHQSVGTGFVFGNVFRKGASWEMFFSIHKAVSEYRTPKFYFGVKI